MTLSTMNGESGGISPQGGYYYDMVSYPLASASLAAVEAYTWPDPLDPGRVRGVEDQVSHLYQNSEFALEARGLIGLWRRPNLPLVGFECWLKALMNPLNLLKLFKWRLKCAKNHAHRLPGYCGTALASVHLLGMILVHKTNRDLSYLCGAG